MKPATGIFFSAVLLVLLGLTMIWSSMHRRAPARPATDDHSSPDVAVVDRQIEPFTLTSAQGEPFDTRTLEGEVWVASFFFTACPSICKQQNQQIAILQEEFADQGVKFVSITCDPENDTLPVLRQYADSFQARPDVWTFLTGEMDEIQRVSEEIFQVGFAKQTHSERLLVVDKTGRLRGTYLATHDSDFRRTRKLLEELVTEPYQANQEQVASAAETPPTEQPEQTMDRFQLTDSLGLPFDSQTLDGQVWLGSFFYTSCPSICVMQNMQIARLQAEYKDRGLKFVSITCDPENDTPDVLAGYGQRFQAVQDVWYFCTGDFDYVQQIGQEFFNIPVEEKYHSDRVFLVDREGKVVDSFRTREEVHMKEIRGVLDDMLPASAADEGGSSPAVEQAEISVEEVESAPQPTLGVSL